MVKSYEFPAGVPLGRSDLGLSDRGVAARGRCRAEHLASLRAHARSHAARTHRRRGLRPLPAHEGRRPHDEAARAQCLSLQHRLGAHFSFGSRRGERRRDGLLRAARRHAARERHRTGAHALPLGPAGRPRRSRRLAQPRRGRLVRRLRGRDVPAPRRASEEMDHAQRALGGGRRRLSARRPGSRPQESLRGADRVASAAARAWQGGPGLSRRRSPRDRPGRQPGAQACRQRQGRRRRRGPTRRRLHEPAIPRPGVPRFVPGRDEGDLRRGLAGMAGRGLRAHPRKDRLRRRQLLHARL